MLIDQTIGLTIAIDELHDFKEMAGIQGSAVLS